MKRCAKHCRPESVHPARADATGTAFLVAAFALCLLAPVAGCVTSGTHEAVVDQRDQLQLQVRQQEQRIEALEASTTSLSEELTANLDQFEDLNVKYKKAVKELDLLRSTEEKLSATLSQQSLELVRSQHELEQAAAEVDRLTSTYTALMSDLESEVAAGEIQIEQLKEGIRVNVSQDILFPSGSAELDPVGVEVLGRVAKQLATTNHLIEVQGHTDNLRISGALVKRYPTNWELASARASRVVRLMQERGVPGERLKVASFASYQPVAPNDSPADRALNRRIEIRLKPMTKEDAGVVPESGTRE
jgi:chemotaxis protein MotB